MKLISFILVAFVAAVAADLCSLGNDLDIQASFSSSDSLVSLQHVAVVNKLTGSGFTNVLNNVSFTAVGLGVITSYGGYLNARVGSILAGATGWGQFNALSFQGTHSVYINVVYRLGSNHQWKTACKRFDYSVGNFRRSEDQLDLSSLAPSEEATRSLEARTDYVQVTPTSFTAEDSTTTWNSFVITTYSSALTNITWGVIPGDSSITIGYPGNGNYVASIAANSVYTTSFSILGGAETTTLNCTVRYRRSGTGSTWQYYSVSRLLLISGGGSSSSVKRIATEVKDVTVREAAQVEASANGVQYIRADYALGVAVAGIALVAAVAVVGAMVLIRRRSTETSA